MSSAYVFGIDALNPDGCLQRTEDSFTSFQSTVRETAKTVQERFSDFFIEATKSCTGPISETFSCTISSDGAFLEEDFQIHTGPVLSDASQLFLKTFEENKCTTDGVSNRFLIIFLSVTAGLLALYFLAAGICSRKICQKPSMATVYLNAQRENGGEEANSLLGRGRVAVTSPGYLSTRSSMSIQEGDEHELGLS